MNKLVSEILVEKENDAVKDLDGDKQLFDIFCKECLSLADDLDDLEEKNPFQSHDAARVRLLVAFAKSKR